MAEPAVSEALELEDGGESILFYTTVRSNLLKSNALLCSHRVVTLTIRFSVRLLQLMA
jgi:hypothetical protein